MLSLTLLEVVRLRLQCLLVVERHRTARQVPQFAVQVVAVQVECSELVPLCLMCPCESAAVNRVSLPSYVAAKVARSTLLALLPEPERDQ